MRHDVPVAFFRLKNRFAAMVTALTVGACLLALFPGSVMADGNDDAFLTKEGIPLKVVVRQPCAIYGQAEKSGPNKPAKMFDFFYVLKPGNGETLPTHNGFYYVSATRSGADAEGWISQDDVVEWPHREALGLVKNDGRELAEFFETEGDLRAIYGGTGNPQPKSREPKGYAGVQLLPILKAFAIKQNGDPVQGYEVAYLHATKGGTQVTEGGPDLSKATLDVVFVIDTTLSMGPFIDATKEVVTAVAKQLSQQKTVPVRFGLVAYRDVIKNPPADWYVDQLFCDLEEGKDVAYFTKVVEENVKEAKVGSEDIPEDVLAGLNCAITGTVDGMPARPGTGNSMKWNPNGFKCIILIGDASGQLVNTTLPYKNKYKLTMEGILNLAQPSEKEKFNQRIIIHTARIENPDQTEDFETCKAQFTQLSQGVDKLNMQGFVGKFDGNRNVPHKDFIDALVDTIVKSQKSLEAGIAGKPIASDTPGFGFVAEYIKQGHAGVEDPGASATPFARGFACEVDRKGNAMMEPRMLVQYGDLKRFIQAVDFIVSDLKAGGGPGNLDAAKVLQNLTQLVTSLSIKENVDANTPFSVVLNYTMAIPVKSKVFDMTIHKLANMTQADFDRWVSDVDKSIKVVREMLGDEKKWISLGEEQPLQKRQGFIPVTDLP